MAAGFEHQFMTRMPEQDNSARLADIAIVEAAIGEFSNAPLREARTRRIGYVQESVSRSFIVGGFPRAAVEGCRFVFTIRNCSYDLYTQRRYSCPVIAALAVIFVIRRAPREISFVKVEWCLSLNQLWCINAKMVRASVEQHFIC
jgi:hypothetical protein